MNGQSHQDRQHVVPQLCEHLARVLHGHQLSRDQEDNPKGRVPEPRKDGIKSKFRVFKYSKLEQDRSVCLSFSLHLFLFLSP